MIAGLDVVKGICVGNGFDGGDFGQIGLV